MVEYFLNLTFRGSFASQDGMSKLTALSTLVSLQVTTGRDLVDFRLEFTSYKIRNKKASQKTIDYNIHVYHLGRVIIGMVTYLHNFLSYPSFADDQPELSYPPLYEELTFFLILSTT